MTVVLVGAVVLLAVTFLALAWPLVSGGRRAEPAHAGLALQPEAAADPLAELSAERDSIYQAIRELRFDFEVGKVSEADYKAFDAQLRTQAARTLQRIDALATAETDPARAAQLEQEIAARRQTADPPAAEPDEALPASTATRPRFCPQCGQRLAGDDRFCGACGHAIA